MSTSALSFQGLASGLQTDSLVNAIIQQEGQPVQRMQAKQTANSQELAAIQSLQTNMTDLSTSLAMLAGTSFDARAVTSTDSNGTYVTATAKGSVPGSYDLQVTNVATAGRITPTMLAGVPQNLAVADPLATTIFDAGTSGTGTASFAIKGTDGIVKTLTLTSGNNNLYGLRDAINALGTADPTVPGSTGLGVTATVVNTGTGTGTNAYELVLTAKLTGTGTGGAVTIADVTNNTSGGLAVNSLGIGHGTVDSMTAPTSMTGGLSSGTADVAKDAVFTVNGLKLTRQSNTVTDAVDGVTFTLKQGGQATPTTLTVGQDKSSVTSSMQDVVSKFNALITTYKNASAITTSTTTSASGTKSTTTTSGPLANNSAVRSLIAQVRSALSGVPSGLPSSSTFLSAADLGVTTNRDGTLSLNTTTLSAALDKDPVAAKRVFAFSGQSSNGAVSFFQGGAKTTTGTVGFTIDSFQSGGAVSGTFTVNGTKYTLSGSNGTLSGTAGTPLEGLILSVSGLGSGNLSLSRGVGQAARDVVSNLTALSTGNIPQIIASITAQNTNLTQQITLGQARLDRRRVVLQAQFSKMEAAVSQLQSAGSSLSGLA